MPAKADPAQSSGVLICATCAVRILDAPVRVEEQYREATHTYEGHPVETELRASFAGTYCTIECAISGLTEEVGRRARRADLRATTERRLAR